MVFEEIDNAREIVVVKDGLENVTVVNGPMYAGKTTRAIALYEQLEGKKRAYKSVIDLKNGENLHSHNGLEAPAKSVDFTREAVLEMEAEILREGYQAVIIDEVSFFHPVLTEVVARNKIDWYLFGPNPDCSGRQFTYEFEDESRKFYHSTIADLIGVASKVHYLRAECEQEGCQRPAEYTQRIGEDFSPRCKEHFVPRKAHEPLKNFNTGKLDFQCS